MIFLIAFLAGIFTASTFIPGITLIFGGLVGLQSDKPKFAITIAALGMFLVFISMGG